MLAFNKLIQSLYFKQKNNLAIYCQLTFVFNRNWFNIVAPKLFRNKATYLTMLDLNNLKGINDTLGHIVGDNLLKDVAFSLRETFNGDSDYICRYGGDEFVLFSSEDPKEKLKKIETAISFGVTYKLPSESIFSAIVRADNTMYIMKQKYHAERRIDERLSREDY